MLKQYKNLVKAKFFVYLPHSKSNTKKEELIARIRNLGGEVTYSVNKGINFLVVSDQTFKLTNAVLLKEGAIFTDSVSNDPHKSSGKNSAEKTLSKAKQVFNDRSLRLLSSSSGFAHDPSKFCKGILPSPKKEKEVQQNVEFRNLYEFLNCKRWNLITVSDLTHKLDLLESDYIDWHVYKGFKPSPSREAAHIVLTSFSGKWKKEMQMNAHTFQFNPKINKYDVSKLNLEAPDGTSIFQTAIENEIAETNYVKLMNKHEGNVHRLKQLPPCRSQIEEQVPVQGSSTCTICNMKYYNYFDHVNSPHHRNWIRKFDKDYKKIDTLCEDLIKESSSILPRAKSEQKSVGKIIADKITEEKNLIKRKLKEQTKEDQRMIQYIHDRLVVMQIETQSQPFNRNNNQNSWMMENSHTKNSNEEKKWYSPHSNSIDFSQNWVRPFPYIQNRVRRHVAKRPKKEYEYDKFLKKNQDRRAKRNKRLRQTYFATGFANNFHSFDIGNGAGKKKRLVDSTIDMYFPVKETPDIEMVAVEEQ